MLLNPNIGNSVPDVFPKQLDNLFSLEKHREKLKNMPSDNNHNRSRNDMDEVSSTRLWKSLDGITSKLDVVQDQLQGMVRLQEKVNNHADTLQRFGKRLDNHEERQRAIELWQAEKKDTTYVDIMLSNVAEKLTDFTVSINNINNKLEKNEKRIDALEINNGVSKGQKDVGKEVLKWISVVLGSIVVYMLTKGAS